MFGKITQRKSNSKMREADGRFGGDIEVTQSVVQNYFLNTLEKNSKGEGQICITLCRL